MYGGDSALVAAQIAAVGDGLSGSKLLLPRLLQLLLQLRAPPRIEEALKSTFCGDAVSELRIVKSFSVSNIEASFVYVNNVFLSSICDCHEAPFRGETGFVCSPVAEMIEVSEVVSALNYYGAKLHTREELSCQVFDCLRCPLRSRSLMPKLACACGGGIVGNAESVYPTTLPV